MLTVIYLKHIVINFQTCVENEIVIYTLSQDIYGSHNVELCDDIL